MTDNHNAWADTLTRLLALAARLEDEGQYNIAKLARAGADALGRRAAWQRKAPTNSEDLADQVEQAAAALVNLDGHEALAATLRRGAAVLAAGRVPLIDETPHPYVCRTCGHLTLSEPTAKCPTCGAWPQSYQRFMPNYWFDALEPFAALEAMRRTPEDVAALLDGLPEDAMTQPPPEGGWAIRNIITHLRDAQDVFAFRLDLFIKAEHPVLEMKAVWTWAAREEERPQTTSAIIAAYRVSRAETLAKLEALPLMHWWRTGRHDEFGDVTLRQQVSYFASHEITHLPQIESLHNLLAESRREGKTT